MSNKDKNNQTSESKVTNHENNTEMKMENQNTNQRGGEEYTSITGGPGLPGGYSDQPLGFDAVLQEENTKTFAGGTGGLGGMPEAAEEVIKDYSYEELLAKLKEEVPHITDQEFLIKKIRQANADYDDVFEKASKIVSAKAYVAGTYLNQLQFLRSRQSDWVSWASKKFPNLSKTARENRMNIAKLPGVENHFALGVERLAEFARRYNKMTAEVQGRFKADPIAKMLLEHEVDMTVPLEENRTKVDAILLHYDLAAKKISVSLAILEKFLNAKLKITAADRKHMAAIAKNDDKAPGEFLNAVRRAGGSREGLLFETVPDGSGVTKKIKNIDTQVSKLRKSLDDVFDKGKFEGKVDHAALDKLIESLQTLRSNLRKHTQPE